jgi:hypothetical protein
VKPSDYVHYGCGLCAPPGWRNFDASPTLRLARIPLVGKLLVRKQAQFPANVEYGDIVRGLPVAAETCCGVYCSHVLEHLALADFRVALRHTYRILRAGAVFRLVLPDLAWAIQQYVQDTSPNAAYNFLQATSLGQEQRPQGAGGLVRVWLGHSAHRWMWDYKALEQELRLANFVAIRRAQFGDSDDPKFAEVEVKARWTYGCGVECRKAPTHAQEHHDLRVTGVVHHPGKGDVCS